MRRPSAGLVVALLGAGLLLAATAAQSRSVELSELDAFRRLWSDMALGIDAFLDARRPLAPGAEPVYATEGGLDADRLWRRLVVSGVRSHAVRPWQFWRTIPERPFLRARLEPILKPYDDHGRGRLLGLGFRVLGGIAPFLVVWLGALVCAPIVAWAGWELVRSGYVIAAAVFTTLLALWCFWVESLALTRYAVGFYLVALLLVVPLAAYAILGPVPSAKGLSLRALAAAAAFAVAATCRSSVGLVLPGLLLAIGLGVLRLPASRARRSLLFVALGALFLLPYPAMRRSQQSDVWQPLWEGLGDYDREKGHTWSDAAALEAVRAAGGRRLWTPRSEAIFRDAVLRHVSEDPAWYAAILAKRTLAVVFQTKLWPWTPRDGRPISASTSENEGVIDKYYGYAATADHFGLGAARIEVPVTLLLLPLPLLLLRAAAPRRLSWSDAGKSRARAAAAAAACVAAGAFALPVLVTTAGGQETQAFTLVHLLAASLLLDALLARPITATAGHGRLR